MTDENQQLIDVLDRRVERRNDRRAFFKTAIGAAAAAGAGAFLVNNPAAAQTAPTDVDILNFALNLEYLEANFYAYAVTGLPIAANLSTGSGNNGYAASVAANATAHRVPFTDPVVAAYAREIAQDELNHVTFLRNQLTAVSATAAVAQPQIDVGVSPTSAFSNAARAAGIITAATDQFDPYASDTNFLLGAFIFEDVGVTAYKGASPLITNKTYLEAAAGILAVEAYHASIVRTVLYAKGVATPALITNAGKISDARDSLDGTSDVDQGIAPITTGVGPSSNIVPTDSDALAFSRTAGQVLNVVYLNNKAVTMGGFFPAGVNGTLAALTTSAAN